MRSKKSEQRNKVEEKNPVDSRDTSTTSSSSSNSSRRRPDESKGNEGSFADQIGLAGYLLIGGPLGTVRSSVSEVLVLVVAVRASVVA